MHSLICARINGWVNNRAAGDLKRLRTNYNVIVMRCFQSRKCSGGNHLSSWSRGQLINLSVSHVNVPDFRLGLTSVDELLQSIRHSRAEIIDNVYSIRMADALCHWSSRLHNVSTQPTSICDHKAPPLKVHYGNRNRRRHTSWHTSKPIGAHDGHRCDQRHYQRQYSKRWFAIALDVIRPNVTVYHRLVSVNACF